MPPPQDRSDSAASAIWLERARQGDQSAFRRLFDQYRARLKKIVESRLDPKIRQRIDPSDIVQETQLEAFRRIRADRGPVEQPFSVWLFGIAMDRTLNARRDHHEAQRRSVAREQHIPDDTSADLVAQLFSSAPSPGRALQAKESARLVESALQQLPAGYKQVVLMRVYEGLSNAEVAAALNIASDAASKRFGRALTQLGKLLRSAFDAPDLP